MIWDGLVSVSFLVKNVADDGTECWEYMNLGTPHGV